MKIRTPSDHVHEFFGLIAIDVPAMRETIGQVCAPLTQ